MRINDLELSNFNAALPYAHLTLQATATAKSSAGIQITKTIEETVEYALRRSSVFNYAYFVNNYGWFQGSGCTANGDIRANENMSLDRKSYINGFAFAAPNDAMGYEARSGLYSYQENLEMPFLGDLETYRDLAYAQKATIKQNGKTLVDESSDPAMVVDDKLNQDWKTEDTKALIQKEKNRMKTARLCAENISNLPPESIPLWVAGNINDKELAIFICGILKYRNSFRSRAKA